MKPKTELGKAMAAKRVELNMSVGEMAKKLDYGSNYLAEVECGSVAVSDSFVETYCMYFTDTIEEQKYFRKLAFKEQEKVTIWLKGNDDLFDETMCELALLRDKITKKQLKEIQKILKGDK